MRYYDRGDHHEAKKTMLVIFHILHTISTFDSPRVFAYDYFFSKINKMCRPIFLNVF